MKIQLISLVGIGECSGGDGTSDGGCPLSMSHPTRDPSLFYRRTGAGTGHIKPCPLMPWCGQVPSSSTQVKLASNTHLGQAGCGKEKPLDWMSFHFPSTNNSIKRNARVSPPVVFHAPLCCTLMLHYVISVCLRFIQTRILLTFSGEGKVMDAGHSQKKAYLNGNDFLYFLPRARSSLEREIFPLSTEK